jgi:uncharacterized protein YabN with tetrapyrrole methylase and pyrophosphatase domain
MHPHLQRIPETESDWFEALAALARYLRSPDGCPWDREHSAREFGVDAAEEAGELNEAFASGDTAHIEEEFGDTFFVLLATAIAAEEEGLFSLKNALQRAHDKMIRRHEHVFGDREANTPEDAVASWNEIKAQEKESRLKGKTDD